MMVSHSFFGLAMFLSEDVQFDVGYYKLKKPSYFLEMDNQEIYGI